MRPETTAPNFRSIDQYSGDRKAPSAFWAALKEADEFCELEDRARELEVRVDELTEALREEKEHSQALWSKLMAAEQKLRRLQNKGW